MKPGYFIKEVKEEVFINKLHEFVIIPGYDKFKQGKKVCFRDMSLTFAWFNKNRYILSDLDIDDAKLAIKQYNEMTELEDQRRIEVFEKRATEFEKEKDINKFNTNYKKIKFTDGTVMSFWFEKHKDVLLNRNGTVFESIQRQYDDYKYYIEHNKISFKDRLKEFKNIDNLLKFNGDSEIKFDDGTNASIWFNIIGKKALSLDDEISLDVKKQYSKYLKLMSNDKEKIYQQRLREFEQKKGYDKFKQSKTKCVFSDGKVMSSWFFRNKNRILSDNDKISISIQKQYKEYKTKYGNSAAPFEDRLIEFEQNENLDKFKQTFCEVHFKDGANMGTWFASHDDEIREMKNNQICLSILKQHEEYLNLPKNWRAKIGRNINVRKKA